MIKIYDIYKDRNNANDCTPTLTAFVGCDLKSLKEMVPKKTQLILYDLTEHRKSENYILAYFPTIKHYLLDTVENFVKKYPYTKWIHIGSIK